MLSTPYLTTATDYYNSSLVNKLPQDFKPIGFNCELHAYTLDPEYFLPSGIPNVTEYLSQQDVIDQNTNYLLFISCINEEY